MPGMLKWAIPEIVQEGGQHCAAHSDDQQEADHHGVGQVNGQQGDLGDGRVVPVGRVDDDHQGGPVQVPEQLRPSRIRKPNVKYSAELYDLSLLRTKSMKSIRRAM